MDEDELPTRQHQQYEDSSRRSSSSRDASSPSSLVAAYVTKTDITEPLGMELDIANGHTIITEIAFDSLAYHTDLRPGMIIKSINHVECHGKTIPQVRHLLATAIPTVAILAHSRDERLPYGQHSVAAPVSETMMKGDDEFYYDGSYSDERLPPPGLPSGGYWIVKHYAGVTTMVAFFVGCFCFYGLGPIALCCPCDERVEYVVDGGAYNTEVSFFLGRSKQYGC